MILTFSQAWLGPLALAIFGAGFLGLGLMAFEALDFSADLEAELRQHGEAQVIEEKPERTSSGESTRPGLEVPEEVTERFRR
jgi:hypothetical protein